MSTYDDELDEYEVKISYRSGQRLRDKKLRILNWRNCPKLQLVSVRSGKIKDVSISKTPKVFLGFSERYNYNHFKLILKRQIITIQLNDKHNFDECYLRINKMLQTHQSRESGISITSIPRNDELINSDRISSGFPSTDDNPRSQKQSVTSDLEYQNVIRGYQEVSIRSDDSNATKKGIDFENTNDDTYNVPNDETNLDLQIQNLYANIFERQYDVPEYKNVADQLKKRYDDLEKFVQQNPHLNITPNIYRAMKIRLETLSESGVKVEISEALIACLKVKEIDKKLWIIEVFEAIQGQLYVGDRIVEVNGIATQTLFEFQTQAKQNGPITLTIQRIPNGKVFVFDKTKLKIDTIKEDAIKKRFVLTDSKKIKESTDWQITEVNSKNSMSITDSNSFQNIKCIMKSDLRFFTCIVHSCQFIRSLTRKR